MKNSSLHRLDNIVVQKSRELGFNPIKRENSGSVVSILRDDWHLAIELSSPDRTNDAFSDEHTDRGFKNTYVSLSVSAYH